MKERRLGEKDTLPPKRRKIDDDKYIKVVNIEKSKELKRKVEDE